MSKNNNNKKDEKKKDEKKKDEKKKDDKKDDDKKNDDKKKLPSIILLIETKKNNNCDFCQNPNCEGDCFNNNENKENNENNEDDDYYDDNEDYDNDYYDDNGDYYDDNGDYYYDGYYNDQEKDEEKKNNEDENKTRKNKRRFDDNPDDNLDDDPLSFFFKNIINNANKKEVKKQKKNNIIIDEFKSYFKEAIELKPIHKEIKTLKDLIELGKTYDEKDLNRYVINLKALNKCVKPLEDLEAMIGMKNVKEMIIDLIFFRLQNLEDNKDELWHLVIQGTPGSGKTEVAKIIGKLYFSLGITKKDKFTLVKRSDLIGKYLGHTAKMTQQVFDDAKGGILFIDEAYSLGNPEQRDSFSKECIDTINQNLTENKDTVVFIAGYKDQLNESFFSYNPGLNRRFKMRLTIDKYNAPDLREIFLKKIKENEWNILNDDIEKEIPLIFFEKNVKLFKYNGGDMKIYGILLKLFIQEEYLENLII